jgi:predicted DNA-binding protein
MWWGYCMHNSSYMRDKHYKIKGIRLSEETWDKLKSRRKKSGKSWNLFIMELIEKKK